MVVAANVTCSFIPCAYCEPNGQPSPPELILPRGHKFALTAIALNSSGTQVATGSQDGTIILWDAAFGLQIRTLDCSQEVASTLAYSDDGTQLCAGFMTGQAMVWDVATGRKNRSLSWHVRPVSGVVFTKNGDRLLTASGDGSAILWDLETGLKLRSYNIAAPMASAAISPDGRIVAIGGGERLLAWKDRNNRRDDRRPDFSDSPDATALVVWDVESGKRLQNLVGHQGPINTVNFSPDGKRLISGSSDKTAIVWGVEKGEKLQTLALHESEIMFAGLSLDGSQALTASSDGLVLLANIDSGKKAREIRPLKEKQRVTALGVSRDQTRLAASGGGSPVWGKPSPITLVDVATGKALQTLAGYMGVAWAEAFSSDGKQIAVATGNNVVIFRTTEPQQRFRVLRRLGVGSGSAEFSRDGRRLLVSSTLYEIATAKQLNHWALNVNERQFSGSPISIALSSDEQRLLAYCNGTSALTDLATGKAVRVFPSARSVAFSADAKYMAAGFSPPLLCDAVTGNDVRTMEKIESPNSGPHAYCTAVAFSPDGKYLAGTTDHVPVGIWEVSSGKLLHTVKAHDRQTNSLTFSPDSKQLLTLRDQARMGFGNHSYLNGGPTAGMLWDVVTGKKLREFSGHLEGQHVGFFYPKDNLVAIGSLDGTVIFWNATTAERKLTLLFLARQEESEIDWLALTPEGFFDGSERATRVVSVRAADGIGVQPLADGAKQWHRPGLLEMVLGAE